ncbi:glycosyltransferase family A protein [Aurantimonas sp. A2-1-M11]|uniref:glycosyltransferase family 2 protein n=1 Tax=Aurantimonas sp. A2-1-M11 TaxID=3113712 RepID=UPI002F953F20
MASVDVAIPCYKHGRFLRDCVRSVLDQGIEDLRILVIDNASTDDSVEVARRLADEDSRVQVAAHAVNLGPHASFNEGVDWAEADYFMVLCSDDALTPGSLPRMLAVMESKPDVSFAYGTDVHVGGGADEVYIGLSESAWRWRLCAGGAFIEARCRNPARYIAAGMVLVRTSAQKAAGHYRSELPHTDDFEMLLRLASLGQVARTEAVVGIKRMHGDNRTLDFLLASRTRDLVERLAAFDSFFGREGSKLPDAGRLHDLGRRSVAERAYWCGIKDLLRGRAGGVEFLRLAFHLDQRLMVLPPVGYLSRTDRGLADSVRGVLLP